METLADVIVIEVAFSNRGNGHGRFRYFEAPRERLKPVAST
jgi:hypothetical protein